MKVIIYKQDSGVVAVIKPAQEELAMYGIKAIADKDVPSGKPYKIIDVIEIPTDRTFRAAWTVDEADLIDGVGSELSEFQEVK